MLLQPKVICGANTETKRKALQFSYMEIVKQDVSMWFEDTDLLNWLDDFCR
ncbi:hypothetical protein [Virgibacillus profundi]|uniref:hypothetical protein n=1 Tax=Virgibacillus profundi TaxID=2024555 RepID=UPI0013FD404D|nr:hypothetical protein [Virgibacillus profundi]